MAEPYRSQLSANATPLSAASPESFGAAVGRGLAVAGEQIDQAIHQLKQKHRSNEAAEAGVELANVSSEIDRQAIDGRSTAAPGGEGHTEFVVKAFDARSTEALAKIRDPHIKAAFTERYAQLKEHVFGREYGWEAAARIDKVSTDFDDMGSTLANGSAANPDPVGAQVSMDTIETAGRNLAVPADLQTKLIREQQRKVALAFANRLVDDKPKLIAGDGKTSGLLDREVFNRYLEPEDINTLRSGAHVEIRRQEALAERKLNEEKADAREFVSLLGQRVTGGDPTVTDEEFKKGLTLTQKYDLPTQEFNLKEWGDLRAVTRETRDWIPSQWKANINALAAKGDKMTQAEGIRLKHLQALSGTAIDRFNSDPQSAAAAAGNPAPALDPANPQSVQGRVTWARAFARSAGLQNVPYLSPDEMKPLRDRAAQGPAGQIAIAGELRQTFGVATAAEIARQVDPNNRDLQLMVGLVPVIANQYSRGVDAFAKKTVAWAPAPEDNEKLREIWQQYLPAIPADMQPAVLNAAKNIAAGMAAEQHLGTLSGDDLEGFFRIAVQRAGGLTGTYFNSDNSPGGFRPWNDRFVWLPPTMTRPEFAKRVSRAGKAEWEKAGGGAPYYAAPDGKRTPLNDSQISHLRDYSFETVNPGLYRLVGPDGGHVVGKDGQPWQFDVRKLGAGFDRSGFDRELADHGYVRR